MIWNLIAKCAAHPLVANYLIKRAMRTPYSHLDGYMNRYWLVPYTFDSPSEGCGFVSPWRRPLAAWIQRKGYAIRVHHILREDLADHPHDHPWNARTVILRGHYLEQRAIPLALGGFLPWMVLRTPGNTASISYGEYHKIVKVSFGGVWTLFITRKYEGSWGFLVDGRKVPWREYTGRN